MNIKLSITEAQYDLEDPKSLISALREFGCIGEWRDGVTMSIETRNNRLSDEEALELRAWIAGVGAEVNEGVLMAFIAGCSNPFSPATRFELQEIIEEMEGVMQSPETWNQLFDHQRKDVEDTLEMAQSALATFDTGDVTWIAQDDDGYYFREVPRAVARNTGQPGEKKMTYQLHLQYNSGSTQYNDGGYVEAATRAEAVSKAAERQAAAGYDATFILTDPDFDARHPAASLYYLAVYNSYTRAWTDHKAAEAIHAT